MATQAERRKLFETQLTGADAEPQSDHGPEEFQIQTNVWNNFITPVIESQADKAKEPAAVAQLNRENVEETFQVQALRQAVSVLSNDAVRERRTEGEESLRVTTLSGNDEDGYRLHSSVRFRNKDGGFSDDSLETFYTQSDGEEIVRINSNFFGQVLSTELRFRERSSLAAQTGGSYVLRVNSPGSPSVTIVGRETQQGKFDRAEVTVSSTLQAPK